jgi:hypothetical protein
MGSRSYGGMLARVPDQNMYGEEGRTCNRGGEGGIRTPDTRKGMPDFESGAFNRALPPLRAGHCRRSRYGRDTRRQNCLPTMEAHGLG